METGNFDPSDAQGVNIFQLVAGARNFEDLWSSFCKEGQFEIENFLKLYEQNTIGTVGCPTLPQAEREQVAFSSTRKERQHE